VPDNTSNNKYQEYVYHHSKPLFPKSCLSRTVMSRMISLGATTEFVFSLPVHNSCSSEHFEHHTTAHHHSTVPLYAAVCVVYCAYGDLYDSLIVQISHQLFEAQRLVYVPSALK
jgi:hypothetical protein